MKRVLVIGASGLVGGNVLRYFSRRGCICTGTCFSYPVEGTVFFDPCHLDSPRNFDIEGFSPEVVVHTAARTNVEDCEVHVAESYEATVRSTENLVAFCQGRGIPLVYLSTDYIFDPRIEGPYTERSPIAPPNVYGAHKWAAESLVRKNLEHHLIVRIANVYGDEARGKNFVARLISACRRQATLEMRLPYDQYSTPTNAWDIARALYRLIHDGKRGTYHVASTDFMNRCQLAERVLRYFPGHRVRIRPVSTAQLRQVARRPLQGGLKSTKFLREYPDFVFHNVDDYLRRYAQSRGLQSSGPPPREGEGSDTPEPRERSVCVEEG